MIWVINSNSNTCRIYQYDKKHAKLNLVKEIQHPENKLPTRDTISDRPGHYKANGSKRGAYSQPTDPKDIKIDDFYRQIANDLDRARSQNSFKELIVITAPHTNGLLINHMNKHVQEMVSHNIQKDLINLSEKELLEYLRTNTKYQD